MQSDKIVFVALCLPFLFGFSKQASNAAATAQPAEERQAQNALPKSADPMWKLLSTSKIHMDQKTGLFSATITPPVKALVGKQVTISGFMLPLEASETFKHFIISKRTPTCPFCPPGEPNEIMDVWLEKPVAWREDQVKVSGTFELMNNPELGMFFKLSKARTL